MDTFKIIKELTAKTDMISGESIKDNFKELLPIVAVAKGWGLYGGKVLFDFKPDKDYPHKEPYKIETNAFNEAERYANVEEVNEDIDKYNDWVDEQNVINREELFEKIPEANWEKGLITNVYDVEDLNLEIKRYYPLSRLSAWISAFPDIVAMRDSGSDGKNLPRGDSQGDTELYSNFGFMHVT